MQRLANTPPVIDWIVALVGAAIAMNLNVTAAGDPLSGLGASSGPATPGITDTGRIALYGSVAVIGAVLFAACVVSLAAPRRAEVARLAAAAYGLLTAAGLAGLLLDYRDGPVRTVHFVFYVSLVAAVVRSTRVVACAAAREDTTAISSPDLERR